MSPGSSYLCRLLNMLSWKQHISATLVLAVPICFSNLGHILVDVADSFFVGQIGTAPQAAVMLAGTFYILALVFAIGMSYGITPLVAEAAGKGEQEKIPLLLKNAFIANFAICILMFLVLFFCAPLLRYLDQPEGVVEIAIPFLNVIMFSMIPLSFFFTLKQFAEGLSDTKAAMYISIGANLLNVLLNYLLVFGSLGFPEMGVMGSCWATFISRCAMAAGMYLYVYYSPRFRQYREGFRMRGFSRGVLKKLFRTGIPAGLQFTFEVGAFSAAGIFVGWLKDDVPMAAHRIALSLAACTYMVSSGIGAAATVRVGHFLGLGGKGDYRRAGYTALLLSLGFMIFGAVLFILFPGALTGSFNKDHQVVDMAASLLLIAAVFQLSDGTQVVALGMLRGLQDMNMPTVITLVAYWLITLPACYILGFTMELGVHGIWYGFVIGLTIAGVALLWRFEYVCRKLSLK
ncbi:MAG: putative efflux protein, MATE family [Bacteroidetes bacterium]|nr:MAG: putative efflux protein, MATE family [Bacteroidota bacterium]